ncbi:hypothetical protein D3C76_1110960 [compost metagenome]
MVYRIIQGHHRKNSFGDRQDDAEQNREIIGAVQLGGFHQLIGNALEIGLHNHKVEGADGTGKNNRQAAVDQTQILHQKEGRNHAAAEKHGEGNQLHHKLAAVQIHSGKGIGCQGGHQQVKQCPHDYIEQGIQIPGVHLGVLQHHLVGLQAEALRHEHESPALEQHIRITDR